MIEVGKKVIIPRSNGGTIVGEVICISDNQAWCTWKDSVPSNVLCPEAHAMSANPCVRMVEAVQGKWVALSALTLA
jgi:hypothetical protein